MRRRAEHPPTYHGKRVLGVVALQVFRQKPSSPTHPPHPPTHPPTYLGKGVLGISPAFLKLVGAKPVALQVFGVFRLDGVELTRRGAVL